MEIIKKVRETINKYHMPVQGDHVLVGLSGGPDSVCLLTILHRLKPELGISLSAAYIDHGLRPEETPYEIDFCKKLCSSMGIPFITRSSDVKSYAKENKLNKQEAARELRYKALDETASEMGADKIALGHNSDDQTETVLMRLFRGAGASGLSGIPPVRKHIIRPLIETERNEIEDFLKARGIDFVTDSSNLDKHYMRNKIRHSVMPAIKSLSPDAVKTISRTADIFRDEERYFDILVTKTLMKLITSKTGNAIELFLSPLEAMDRVILRRVLRRAIDETGGLRGISFVHIEDMISLIKSGKSGDRIYLPKGIRVIKGYSTLLITSEKPLTLGTYFINSPGEIAVKEASILIRCTLPDTPGEKETFDYGDGKKTAAIDADRVQFPLQVRSRLSGDYFYPIGFGKKKKLQDYFVDEKIPRDVRDSIPLLINNNEIVWVIGHRLDERYRIDKTSKRILKFEVKPLKF